MQERKTQNGEIECQGAHVYMRVTVAAGRDVLTGWVKDVFAEHFM